MLIKRIPLETTKSSSGPDVKTGDIALTVKNGQCGPVQMPSTGEAWDQDGPVHLIAQQTVNVEERGIGLIRVNLEGRILIQKGKIEVLVV
jgi:hypothetical protein